MSATAGRIALFMQDNSVRLTPKSRLCRLSLSMVLLSSLVDQSVLHAQVVLAPPKTPGEKMTVSVVVETPSEKRIGNGFVATEHGHIITSYRLVAGAKQVKVLFRDQTYWEVAGYIGMDAGSDLILLKLYKPRQLTAAPLTIAAQDPRIDDNANVVYGVLGALQLNAAQREPPSSGRITALPSGREIDDLLEFGEYAKSGLDANATWLRTSFPATEGHRGAPVLNPRGEVVGMALWTPEFDGGLNLAVPASKLARLLEATRPTLNSQAHNLKTLNTRLAKSPAALAPPPLPLAAPIQGQESPDRFQQHLQRYSANRARLQVIDEDVKVSQRLLDATTHEGKVLANQVQALTDRIAMMEPQVQAAKRAVVVESERKGKDGEIEVRRRTEYRDTPESQAIESQIADLRLARQKLVYDGLVASIRFANETVMRARVQAEEKRQAARVDRDREILLFQLCQLPGMPVRKDGQRIFTALSDELARIADPTNPAVYELELARGLIFQQSGKRENAAVAFDLATKQGSPVRIQGLAARGYLHLSNGKTIEGTADFKMALAMGSKDPVVFVLRGLAYAAAGDFDNAEDQLKLALPLAASRGVVEAEVQRLLAWLYAACPDNKIRDSVEALKAAQRSCVLTRWSDWSCVDALAAAYAEAGKFDQAVQWSQAAADLAGDTNREQCLERRKLYEAGKPLRLDPRKQ